MTIFEALAGCVNYPIPEKCIEKILIDRNLSKDELYNGLTRNFELATADLYKLVITSPDVSEGGYSISLSEKKTLRELYDGIYKKYNLRNPLVTSPKIKNKSLSW